MSPVRGPMFNAAAYFIDRHVEDGRDGRIAVECADRRLSYRDVFEQVNRVGNALKSALGVRPEERVLLLMCDGPEMIAAFFGAIKIGAVPVPLNTRWTAADYEFVLRDSSARVIITSPELLAAAARPPSQTARRLRHVVVVGQDAGGRLAGAMSFEALIADASPALEAEPTSADAQAFWLYSSGSTANRRDACIFSTTWRCVPTPTPGACSASAKMTDASASPSCSSPMGWATHVFSVCCRRDNDPLARAVARRDGLRNHRTLPSDAVLLGPDALRDAAGAPRPGARLRPVQHPAAVSAGEALPPALFERFRERFGVEILDGIGSTEILHIFISNRPGRVRPGSSGLLVPGYEARLLDEHGQPVPAGELGDLVVRGDSTCAFYWNRHEQTKDTISGHWIRTGDKYRQDADGFFWFAGRSDDMLKVGGIWVSPAEVEHLLLEHPAVQACGVTGREDQDGLIKPVAHVVPCPGVEAGSVLVAELQRFARQRLAEYKRPRWIEFVDALPLTATGKVQRFKLRTRTPSPERNPAPRRHS